MNHTDTITNRQIFDFLNRFKAEMTEFKETTNKRLDRIEDTQHEHTKMLNEHSKVLNEHSKHLFELLKRGDTLKVKISGTMILINALIAIFCATIISLLI